MYGYNLEALCCIEALLKTGVPGESIIYVEPVPKGLERPDMHANTLLFNDPYIEEAVHKSILDQGIQIFSSFHLKDWYLDETDMYVTDVVFASKFRVVSIPCIAMFVYAEKNISYKTFEAINKSGLVFDGKLVIDPDCKTNDSFIYAAGALTKYSRKYYAEHMQHRYGL